MIDQGDLCLSELPRNANGALILVDGREVLAIQHFEIAMDSAIVVRLEGVTAEVTQALRVRATNCELEVNGHRMTDAIFWSDSAPSEFVMSVRVKRAPAKVSVWNEWRSASGTQHAWMGNAGINSVREGDDTILRCSDGVGLVDFTDFVVRLSVVERAK